MESSIDHLPAIVPSRTSLPPPSSKTATKANQSPIVVTAVHQTSSSLYYISPTYPSPADSSPGDSPSSFESSGSSGSLGSGAIIGIALGATALILLCGGGWLLRRRRARRRRQHSLEDQEAMERLSRQQREKRATLTLSKSIHKPLDFSALGVSPSREDIHEDYHEQHSLHQCPSMEMTRRTDGVKSNGNNKSALEYQRQVPPKEGLYRSTAGYPPPPPPLSAQSPPGSSSNTAVSSPKLTLVTRQGTGKLPRISPLSPMGSIFNGRGLHKRLSALLTESVGYYPPPPVPSLPSQYASDQTPPPTPLLTRPAPLVGASSLQTDGIATETSTANTTADKSLDAQKDSGPRLGGRKARVPSRQDGQAPSSDTPC